MNRKELERLIDTVFAAREREIGCSAFFEALPRYVDLETVGRDAAGLLPEVHHHLHQCAECEEIYQALLQITSKQALDSIT
jgi:hypothetical protein